LRGQAFLSEITHKLALPGLTRRGIGEYWFIRVGNGTPAKPVRQRIGAGTLIVVRCPALVGIMLAMVTFPSSKQLIAMRWPSDIAFGLLYLLFDWVSYASPMYGLNITPWSPDPALGLVYWLVRGRRAALPWFITLVVAEYLVRGLPAGLGVTLLLSAALTFGYGVVGEYLRRYFGDRGIFGDRRRLFAWLGTIVLGLVANSLLYTALLAAFGLIPGGELTIAMTRFAIGDVVGVVVSMPLIWLLATRNGPARLWQQVANWETVAYMGMGFLLLWQVFIGLPEGSEFKHFYFLFLPIIWAAARQGLSGTALIVFSLQAVIFLIMRAGVMADMNIFELQLLSAVLALVGYFIGIVVDEQRQVAEELKYSLRLAAAGEMAAALAHELNQPITALLTYGKACEHLLARQEHGPLLNDAIGKMIAESSRASEVVSRLREFFRSGALQLEPVHIGAIIHSIERRFQAQFDEHGVSFDIQPMPSLSVRVDRLQIELVLRNLIENAFDAIITHAPGMRHICIRGEQQSANSLCITVEDNGNGVPAEAAVRLFEPFISSKSSGLGLGLVLSRAIIEAHGGTLWAEIGDCGTFRFILPLAEQGEEIAS
jgi:two-component system sensor kinase FixL